MRTPNLARETRILVTPDLGRHGGGTSHETTWGEFYDANKDDPGELSDVAWGLVHHREASMGGGAQPVTLIQLVEARA